MGGCAGSSPLTLLLQAWDDSYSSWRSLTSVLVNYQGEETSPPPDFLAELVAKASKRYSTPAINIDSSDDNIQVSSPREQACV